jgi:hypothetical protein
MVGNYSESLLMQVKGIQIIKTKEDHTSLLKKEFLLLFDNLKYYVKK